MSMGEQQSSVNWLKDKSPIQYQGRTAQRASSRERRQQILEATLRIIAKEGMRGVRHRAVAKEASVPLAATTYYFKDLNDLITDAFYLYVERAAAQVQRFKAESFGVFRSVDMASLEKSEVRRLVADPVAEFATLHIMRQVSGELREQAIIEHAFMHEAIRNENLRPILVAYYDELKALIEQFYQRLNLPNGQSKAQVMLGVIKNLEFDALLETDMAAYEEHVRKTTRTALYDAMGVA